MPMRSAVPQNPDRHVHDAPRRHVSVEPALRKVVRHILHLLLERQVIELAPDRELPVHLLLRDAKVLDVEKALLAHGGDQRLGELLPALGRCVQVEVECD